MSFSLNTDHLPRIRDYDEAAYIEAQIKPIRGREHVKPLGKRSDDAVLIRKDYDDRIIVSYYSNDVLTYEKARDDGQTLITVRSGGWVSQSTAKIIDAVLGRRTCVRKGKMWIHVGEGHYALDSEFDYTLKLLDGMPVDYLPPMCTKTNLSKLKEVRKQYREFKTYMRRMCKVLADVDGLITDIPKQTETLNGPIQQRDILNGSGEESFFKAMVYLMDTTRRRMYNYSTGVFNIYTTCNTYTTYNFVSKKLEDYIRNFHHNEITYKERAQLGVIE